jgi:hypothetical protein
MLYTPMYARTALTERFVLLAGSHSRYLAWLRMQMPEGTRRSANWYSQLLSNRHPVPIRTLVDMVRIAEDDATLTREAAWELRTKWFYPKGEGDDA